MFCFFLLSSKALKYSLVEFLTSSLPRLKAPYPTFANILSLTKVAILYEVFFSFVTIEFFTSNLTPFFSIYFGSTTKEAFSFKLIKFPNITIEPTFV